MNQTAAHDQESVSALETLRLAKRIFDVLLMGIIFLAVGLLLAPRLLGADLMIVLSQSMEPAMLMGALVATRPVEVADIQAGDVITFRSPEFGSASDVVTHRVVEIVAGEGGVRFRTQGDASAGRRLGYVVARAIPDLNRRR